jgi:phage tail sheath protein FI
MATPQLSPGVITREVDLTLGRADNVLSNVGAIAGPFELGPVDEAVDITTEQQLISVFGKPISTDRQYEYWMSAASYLSYGGVLKVVRTNGANLNNANAGVGAASTTSAKIKNFDDYEANYSDNAQNFTYAAKTPGTWGNGLKVCFIDDLADQVIGVTTTDLGNAGCTIGFGVTTTLSGTLAGIGTTSSVDGHLKAIITGVSTDATNGASTIDVKIVSRVSGAGTETAITYKENDPLSSIETGDTLHFVNNSGVNTGGGHAAALAGTAGTVTDWYNGQTLSLTNSTIFWKQLASKPVTNQYSLDRNSKGDAMHVAIVDDNGTVTGVKGTILESNTFLSKAADGVSSVESPERSFYKDFLAQRSQYVYAGRNPSAGLDAYHATEPRATGFSTDFTPVTTANGLWAQDTQDVTFAALGNVTYNLAGGKVYTDQGGYAATLGDLSTSYDLFANKDEQTVDFLINGPGLSVEEESQAKANKLISIANDRKDCIAVISPDRGNVVNVTSAADQTNNVIKFFAPITSSSYAVFDSGYKYTYDRFNNQFRFLPTNADVAGLMVRTEVEQFPWYSPAGANRGTLNNAIKLAYNPNKSQRDSLYESRINSIINQPGSGVILFGDRTGLSFASAFDRINVRRLFLTVEKALEGIANNQLFEFNDEITRNNFLNVVEPYLRDVQAKRGLFDFRVICDETNNTPSVIDNNEFRADIFLKPTRSINFVTLTFVATRTGVDFQEVTGRV